MEKENGTRVLTKDHPVSALGPYTSFRAFDRSLTFLFSPSLDGHDGRY